MSRRGHARGTLDAVWTALLALSLAGCGLVGFAAAPAGQADAGSSPDGDAGSGGAGVWRATTSLPGGRGLTCAVSLDDRIYVIGGGSGSGVAAPLDEVLMGEVEADGSVTTWQQVQALPGPLRWHACAVDPASRTLYVLGGDGGPLALTVVWRALVNGDGSLQAWGTDLELPAARRGLAAYVAAGLLHAVGGESGDGFLVEATVFRADVSTMGTLSPWMAAPPLPAANYMFGAATVGAQAYLTGGWATPTTVLAGTTTAGLEVATPLPAPHQRHASVAVGGYLYVLAGQATFEGAALAEVRRAPITAGAVGAWQTLAPLPRPVTYHTATVVAGRIYVIGGLDADNAGEAAVQVYEPPP